MEEISIKDKKVLKQLLKDGFERFNDDRDHDPIPMPDMCYKMMKIWLNDIDNYLGVVHKYLNENQEATIQDAAIEGVFPYIMAFREFFKEHYIEGEITEKCSRNNKDDAGKPEGVVSLVELLNGATFKLSDTYCYDLPELYGMQPSSGSFVSPMTRENFNDIEQVFMTIIKSFEQYQIDNFAKMFVGGSLYKMAKPQKAKGTKNRKGTKKRKVTKKRKTHKKK
jgi:hypothetical protein